MTAVMDEYMDGGALDSASMEADDIFPCKGCGEILEEGKAFELAGNRWHLDCFRCNTCGTLLDSDANLLLLGDGSLICNNCTYSCSSCGDKIEDLAILTGDQAFCSACFRCRNCKRKIDNLRYARTSQGIFCMSCHESLMARRRKKSKAAAAAKAREKEQSPMVKEKSLPALPPNVIPNNAFSNERVDPDSDTPNETSPRQRGTGHRHNESTASRGIPRADRSPERQHDSSSSRHDSGRLEGLGLPPQSYRNNRNSTIVSTGDDADTFFIPVALDPSPGPPSNPRSVSSEAPRKDYFTAPRPPSTDRRTDSQSSTPHIAFQDRGRQHISDSSRKQPQSRASPAVDDRPAKASPSKPQAAASDDSRLQEVSKPRPPVTARSSSSEDSESPPPDPSSASASNGVDSKDSDELPFTLQVEPRRVNENMPPPAIPQESRRQQDEEPRSPEPNFRPSPRSDSMKSIPRKELPSATPRLGNGKAGQPGRQPSDDAATLPIRQSSRPGAAESQPASAKHTPPGVAHLRLNSQGHAAGKDATGPKGESLSPKASPKLPRWSNGVEFSLDEDMARILGTDEGSSSILRRVSNAVRHGRTNSVEWSMHPPPSRSSHTRSISETARVTQSPRWTNTPMIDEDGQPANDITTPASTSSTETATLLKRQLRNSEQRVAELERQFNSEQDLKNLNKRLIEKRKTVSVLDTQTEIMIRQLEVLAGYVEKAKETKTPVDPRVLEDSALKAFVQKLESVKIAMSEGIELLHEERDQLIEEKNQAQADRDRALMEFEQLSAKNAQLADMNNDLTQQIQGRFKSHAGSDGKSSNGLGIYSQSRGNASSVNLETASLATGGTLVAGDEEPIVESGPTVVQVRKGQVVKKFNWKKGSKTMAHNVAKGVNRAVVAFQNDRDRMQPGGLTGESIGMPYNTMGPSGEAPTTSMSMQGLNQQQMGGQGARMHGAARPGQQGFGFFKKNAMPKSMSANAMSDAPAAAEPPSTLFGSDLTDRTEYERRQIPSVVTRCIEEVELRGMDQEGIYRKTGGNSQVNMIKEGFERSENFDISEPDLDITAVTSVLKQYFRKLPVPLLTFDVYDQVLESTAIVDEVERCAHLRKAFASMPSRHSDCLEFLMFHLDRVAQREKENLMSPKNLAVVFAPTIMRDLSIEREMTDMHAKNLAVQFVIENSHAIFSEEA